MGTLNQYAARVANMIGQPDNQELKERVKDMIKTGFANRIRQSTERNGIDNILKLSFIATVEEKEFKDIHPSQYKVVEGKPVLCTSNKIPVPVRIKNDAPFTFVGTVMVFLFVILHLLLNVGFIPFVPLPGRSRATILIMVILLLIIHVLMVKLIIEINLMKY